MREREVQKNIRLSPNEAKMLRQKAKRVKLTESALIRMLVEGFQPKEPPDERFYKLMRELYAIGNNIHQLSAKANALHFIDAPMLKREAEKWTEFRERIEREFLDPEKGSG